MNILPSEIAFDFDGVVADTFRVFVDIAKSDYNITLNYEDITTYEFMNSVEMDKKIAHDIIETITLYPHDLDLRPNKGSREVLSRLSSISQQLLVTARPMAKPVGLWFQKHMPEVDIEIEATGVNTEKLGVLENKKIRYFVDDRLDTCFMLHEAGITPIVYDQPWNRSPHPFTVVRNWDDISSLINWQN